MSTERALLRAYQAHVADEATIDHLVRVFSTPEPPTEGRVLAATTETGLAIEDQVRKAWNQPVVGLAIF